MAQLLCSFMANKGSDEPLHVCSVGCGDGRFDNAVFLKMQAIKPDSVIEYTGIDLNKSSCNLVRENMVSSNIIIKSVINSDIQKCTVSETFDVVFSVHVLYYLSSLEAGLDNIFKMLKPSGK